jgi:hypothetical protein
MAAFQQGTEAFPRDAAQLLVNVLFQCLNTLLLISIMVGISNHYPLPLAETMAGDLVTGFQVTDEQLSPFDMDTDASRLPGHGDRILVSLPAEQASLVHLTRLLR